jgi:alkanesulfonate monooxygenase SsuD/methylene tetrahydromethanopterin reductase-like flavin-dependent oxidoreductase (luciferase family)
MDLGLFLEFPRGDGVSEQEAIQESFAIVDEAESLEVDSVWLAEYHFNPGRILSAPITIASAIAARTQHMRVGTAVSVLPLGNPVRIAEEVATLDHISQGRLEFGIGRGTFPNVHEGYNVPFAESRGRFEESLEIILKAWTTERFSFEGAHYQCKDVCIVPKPFQQPHPPIRVGITSAESFPIVGRMGYPIIINPSRVFGLSELAPHIQQYRKAWHDARHEGEPQVGLRVPVYVAETAEQAYSDPQESAMFSVRRLGQRVGSYATYGGTTGDWASESERILGMSYDDWLRDKVAFGTPEMVADKLHMLQKELGLTQLIYEINFGNLLSHKQQMNSLRMFNQAVVPQLK